MPTLLRLGRCGLLFLDAGFRLVILGGVLATSRELPLGLGVLGVLGLAARLISSSTRVVFSKQKSGSMPFCVSVNTTQTVMGFGHKHRPDRSLSVGAASTSLENPCVLHTAVSGTSFRAAISSASSPCSYTRRSSNSNRSSSDGCAAWLRGASAEVSLQTHQYQDVLASPPYPSSWSSPPLLPPRTCACSGRARDASTVDLGLALTWASCTAQAAARHA